MRSPIIAGLFVINMMSNMSGGVENPWTIPAKTSALIGLTPKKFNAIAIRVKMATAP